MIGESTLEGARLLLGGQNRETVLVPRLLEKFPAKITKRLPERRKEESRSPEAANKVAGTKYPQAERQRSRKSQDMARGTEVRNLQLHRTHCCL